MSTLCQAHKQQFRTQLGSEQYAIGVSAALEKLSATLSIFFRQHPQIRSVFFNGTKAENSFRKWVLPQLPGLTLELTRLPSTSPANASLSLEKKRRAWEAIVGPT